MPFVIVGGILMMKAQTGQMDSAADGQSAAVAGSSKKAEEAAADAGAANQAASDAFASVRIVQAYNLQQYVSSYARAARVLVVVVHRLHSSYCVVGMAS
jgi:hypothetical protein